MVFCALWKLSAQNITDVEEINDHLEHISSRPSDALFLQQNQAYKQAKAAGDEMGQAKALQKMGQLCYQMGLFTQSLNYHIKANGLFMAGKDELLKANNLNELALIFLITKQEQDAKQSLFKGLSIYQRFSNKKGLAKNFANIGHFYEKTLNYDSAYFYQKKAMEVFESIGDEEGVALVNINLGSIYEDKEQFEKAFFHFHKALDWFEMAGNAEMLIDTYNNLGDVYRKKGKYQDALKFTRKAEQLSKKTKAYSRLSSAYRDLGKTYNFLKNTDSTFHYLELSRTYFLSSYSEESRNQEALLKVIYGLDRKDMQIAEMERQEKISTVLYISTGIVAVLLISIAFVVIRNQRQSIKRDREIGAKEKRILEAEQQLMEAELQNKKLQEDKLQENLHTKAKEITAHTLQTIQKNQLLEDIRAALTEMIKSDGRSYKKELRSLLNKINQNFNKDAYWDDFRRIFEEINQDFFHQLQQINPGLSPTDIKFISLIKLNMNTPDISALLGVSIDSLRVSRYRLRKKLKLEQGASLTAFIQSL